jgi:hypothetical protein
MECVIMRKDKRKQVLKHFLRCIWVSLALFMIWNQAVSAEPAWDPIASNQDALFSMPEPDPPYIIRQVTEPLQVQSELITEVPTTEWTYHKTSDNAHPDGNEQQMV